MTWITDNKGSGPWPFTEQPNKFGYLNNARWSNHPKAAADSMSASEFCEGKGIALDPEHTHKPCGHWHKGPAPTNIPPINIGSTYWWQQSIDVYDGVVGIVGQTYEGHGYDDGIVSAIYDVATEKWASWGVVRNMNFHYAEPGTCRLSSSGYMAHYGSMSDFKNGGYWVDHDWSYSMRLYIFEEGEELRHTDVWSCDWDTGTPYECYDYNIYNTMDCIGDRIACIAYVYKIDGIAYNRTMVKVSEDAGRTFPVEYSFPTLEFDGTYSPKLRMSDDGTIWVVGLTSESSPPYYVQLWKSINGGVSFSKVWERDYSLDNTSRREWYFGWDISDADGRYQTIAIEKDYELVEGDHVRVDDKVIYVTDDYGATFTTKTFVTTDCRMYNNLVANGDYILILGLNSLESEYNFLRSTDEATSFSFVSLEDYITGIHLSYFDMQKNLNEIVTVNCGVPYYTAPDYPESDDYAGVAYSNDSGVTWSVIQSPLQIEVSESDVLIPGTIVTELNEPQVWSL